MIVYSMILGYFATKVNGIINFHHDNVLIIDERIDSKTARDFNLQEE